MKQEDKELLLRDLCARLPYGVIINITHAYSNGLKAYLSAVNPVRNIIYYEVCDLKSPLFDVNIFGIKPYLRPMSSMTKEERKEFSKLLVKRYCEEDWEGHISTSYCIEIDNVYTDDEDGIKYPSAFSIDAIDWLNAHYFDYRGLIEKNLALEAPEGMYNLND